LRFISSAQKPTGAIEAHCQIANGCIAAFDGNITIGARIDEDFEASPHTHSFIAALSKCSETISLTVDENKIVIASDKSRFTVQCAPQGSLPPLYPDSNVQPCNENLKDAFKTAGIFAKEGAARIIEASVLMDEYTLTGTNGYAIIQRKHELDLPPIQVVLPKRFIDLVCKHIFPVVGLGYNPGHSLTVWFEDGSFIKGNVFTEKWPNINHAFPNEFNLWPIPVGLFEAVKSCSDFGDDNNVVFSETSISSYPVKATSATVEFEGLPTGTRIYSGKMIQLVEPYMLHADFSFPDRFYFEGDNVRGVIMGKGIK
jgi:hypothetical protein